MVNIPNPLEVYRALDREIHAPYVRRTHHLLGEADERYDQLTILDLCLTIGGMFTMAIGAAERHDSLISPGHILESSLCLVYNIPNIISSALSCHRRHIQRKFSEEGIEDVKVPYSGFESYTRDVRVLALATGLGLVASSVVDTVRYAFTNELEYPDMIVSKTFTGLGLISSASGMFIRDQDPDIRNREPFYSRWFKKGLVPADSEV